MPEGKSAARQERSISFLLLRAERAFGRGLRGLLAAHSSGVIMVSCAIWISFLFRLPSRSPSILPNASRERAACSSLVSLPSALRSIAQDPLIQRHSRMNVASTDLVFRASAFFERQEDGQIRASPDLRLRRHGLPLRLMRRPHRVAACVHFDGRRLAVVIGVHLLKHPACAARVLDRRDFAVPVCVIISISTVQHQQRRAASTASPPEARSPRERIKDAERARKRSST
jgi:hypothetical protein